MSEGPANGKLRKREVLEDGKWTPVQRNAYDPKGRLIRSAQGDSVRIWEWVDSQDGSEATEYVNGKLARRTIYDALEKIKEREAYLDNGEVKLYRFDYHEDFEFITYYLNGEIFWHKKLHEDGRVLHQKWASGREKFWVYDQNGERKKS